MSELYKLFHMVFDQGCTDESVLAQHFNEKTQIVSYPKRRKMITIFDQASYCYIVLEGEYSEVAYSASGESNLLAVHRAPQMLGIVAMLKGLPYHKANTVVTKPLKAIKIENQYLYSELEKDSRLCLLLLQNLADKLVLASNKIRFKSFYSAKDHFIIYMYNQWINSGTPRDCFHLNKQYVVIAGELDVSERTVYRVLGELKQEGYLSVVNKKIIADSSQIQRMVFFYENWLEASIN